MQWFRFYTEAISDKKLRRIARDNNESMAHVIGVWTIVLSMASDSPESGKLLISDEVPATIDDINDAAGCNATACIDAMKSAGLITENDGVLLVVGWDELQATHETLRPSAEVWAKIRAAVFERDDYTCRYCGKRGVKLECDHVVPVSRGGGNDPSNLVTACFACNRSKHNKTAEEWQSWHM